MTSSPRSPSVLPVLAYYTLVVISGPQLVVDFEKRPLDLPYDTPDPEPEREVIQPPDTELETFALAEALRRQIEKNEI